MALTLDRGSATLTSERIGRTQYITPEGFLLCADVRIARTGPMLYTSDEMPDLEPGVNGAMITVLRDADVLFSADSIASFSGKPVTNDHPSEFVTPTSWRRDAIGVVLNPRRGDGLEGEYLVADLLITDADAIADVLAGKREVSCGYDAEREQIKPGLGRQTKVIGNHVALVDRGRCGPSCAIQDQEGIVDMAKRTVWDRLMTAFKANDARAFEDELKLAKDAESDNDDDEDKKKKETEDADDDDEDKKKKETEDSLKKIIRDAIAPLAKRIAALDAKIKAKDDLSEYENSGSGGSPGGGGIGNSGEGTGAPETDAAPDDDDEDKKKKEDVTADKKAAVKDSASLRDIFNDTMARAEILAPGIKLPTFDARAKGKVTTDALCGLRAKALSTAYADANRQQYVMAVLGSKPADFASMTCDSAELVFRGASELARSANNKAGLGEFKPVSGYKPMTTAAYAQLIKDRRSKQA